MTENLESRIVLGTVVIVGASGYLGGCCVRYFLDRGARVVMISRRCPSDLVRDFGGRAVWVDWADGPQAWGEHLEGADAVINFVGRTVDCRKTPANCDEILRSRVGSIRMLSEALAGCAQPPPVWVQAGTAHIYGDPASERVGDDGITGWGFAPFVGRAWEEAFWKHLPPRMRGVVLRTGFVIGRSGGAFPVLLRLARLGLGGRVSHGRQGFSWIHESDFCGVVSRCLRDPACTSTLNVTAPEPVGQVRFMEALRARIRQPIGLPAPAWAVRVASRFLLNTDPELVLEGRYILPTRLQAMGFGFQYPTLESALTELVPA